MGSEARLLVVFARRPEPGRVKTRLARAIGEQGAASLYAAFVADLARRFAVAPWRVRWQIAPPMAGFAARFGLDAAACREQRGDDLGARMKSAFSDALEEGFARVVLIGSDAPQIAQATIAAAFAALDDADLVLGPALDGGYYLVAMRAGHDVFAGIRWSTATVLADTLARAGALGLRTAALDPIFDVDEPADLDRLREILDRPDVAAELPATAAELSRIDAGRGTCDRHRF
jgi:rSAM/selenodomain-associated transferase 1